MLHLDQNHPSLSPPHSKSNLILSNSPRPDQHALLSWSPPARDDRPFYQQPPPQQEQSVPEQTDKPLASSASTPPTQPDVPAVPPAGGDDNNHTDTDTDADTSTAIVTTDADTTSTTITATTTTTTTTTDDATNNDTVDSKETDPSASTLGHVSPGNAELPKSPEPSTSSPPDATSPAIESSSSLTPPPETTSPSDIPKELPEGEPAATDSSSKVEGPEEEAESKGERNSDETDKASRASTPLSELSSAPDADEQASGERKTQGEDAATPAVNPTDGAKSATEVTAGDSSNPTDEVKPGVNGHVEASSSQQSIQGQGVATPMPHQPQPSAIPKVDPLPSSRAPSLSIATPEPLLQTSTATTQKLDPKVVTILELNAELLKVCMEFQARMIPLSEPRAREYSVRLQNHLTWLAAAADEGSRKHSNGGPPLPLMHPPPAVEFAAMDRIQALYSELPTIFAKDLMRRSQMSMHSANSPQPPGIPAPNGLKRDRSDEQVVDVANKRRDTGDSKGSTPAPSTPQAHSSPVQSITNPMLTPATPPNNMPPPSLPGPSGSSPSMPPPSMPSGLHPNVHESQLAAARERARQMQMRSAMQQGGAMGDGSRQFSPGNGPQQAGMPMQNMAGPSTMSNNPQAQMAALQTMGPSAMQAIQLLQNPGNQLVQYLVQNVPNFQSLPLPQQVQQVQKIQYMMARSRAANAAGQSQAGPMAGMSQGGGPSLQGGNMMSGPMGMQNGSPTRVSPNGQPSMQSLGGFPLGGQGGGAGVDPRSMNANAMSGLSPAQQATLANLHPQQRQLLLIQQQQQMMRGGGINPNMMNNPAFNAQQQQRMSQQQPVSSPHIGSPMLNGSPDGNFPAALRSNPSVPGIARNTRTPSDHAPSPMTPQLSQRTSSQLQEDYQRALMSGQRGPGQIGQGPMGNMAGGNMNPSWPQNQAAQQMGGGQGQGGYASSPPGSASGYSMSTNTPSPSASQQWGQGGQFPFSTGSPAPSSSATDGLGSRQMSNTPGPQSQMLQNSPMGDQTGLNDFDLFNWAQ